MGELALGVDIGWLSQLEAEGAVWVDREKNPVDPLSEMKRMGANAVRLRVFVHPPKEAVWTKRDGSTCKLGFCDREGLLAAALRTKDAGMRLMVDFHYSDHFADPQYQDIPADWKGHDDEALAEDVRRHTREVLTLLKEHDVTPEWAEIGNEINSGILLPAGDFHRRPEALIRFLNAGHDAAKEVFPQVKVVTHLAGVQLHRWIEPFLDRFFSLGGRTDILGFSHYPYWMRFGIESDIPAVYLAKYAERYHKPVMIAETGGPEDEPKETRQLLYNAVRAVRLIPDDQGAGVFYWEPEVGKALLPDHYPLGACRTLDEKTVQFTEILEAYRDGAELKIDFPFRPELINAQREKEASADE